MRVKNTPNSEFLITYNLGVNNRNCISVQHSCTYDPLFSSAQLPGIDDPMLLVSNYFKPLPKIPMQL